MLVDSDDFRQLTLGTRWSVLVTLVTLTGINVIHAIFCVQVLINVGNYDRALPYLINEILITTIITTRRATINYQDCFKSSVDTS